MADVGPDFSAILDEIGQVIDIRGVSTPSNVAIPAEGTPSPIVVGGVGRAWSDDVKWIGDRYDELVNAFGGSFDISPEATRLKAHALAQAQTEAMSGHINVAHDDTATQLQKLKDFLKMQTMYYQRINAVLQAKVDALEFTLASIPGLIDNMVRMGVARASTYTDAVGQVVQAASQNWGVEHIYAPLVDELGALHQNAIDYTNQKVMEGTAVAENAAANALGPVAKLAIETAGALGPALNALKALQQESTDCTQPMCDAFGPKTDFSKLWNKVKGLLGLGLGLEALNLTEPQLEHMAQAFATLAGGGIDTFLSGFAQGGETLGTAGAGLLGDLGTVGKTVLGDLGVPVP